MRLLTLGAFVVAGLLALTTAEKWDGKLPTSLIPGAAVPFVSIGK